MTFESWATSKGIKPTTKTEQITYQLMRNAYNAGLATAQTHIKGLEEQVKSTQLQLSRLPDIISELEKDDKYCHSPIVFDLGDIYHKARIQEAR